MREASIRLACIDALAEGTGPWPDCPRSQNAATIGRHNQPAIRGYPLLRFRRKEHIQSGPSRTDRVAAHHPLMWAQRRNVLEAPSSPACV